MALSHFRGFDVDDFLSDMVPFFAAPLSASRTPRGVLARTIPTDFLEEADKYEIRADMPGITKDQIKLDVEGDVISFGVEQQTESKKTEEKEGLKWHRVERSSQFQKRAMRLPEDVDMDKVNASYDNGVLSIKIAKKAVQPAEGAKRITIA